AAPSGPAAAAAAVVVVGRAGRRRAGRAAVSDRPRALIVALWIGFAVTCAYWLVWFFVDRELLASLHTPAYYAFENAFPLADAWLALGFAASARALQRRRPIAVFWLLVTGSASLYLASMDILFDLENGVYAAPDRSAVITELVINAATVALGVWTLRQGWRNRARLVG
ncbi:MAG TPA: hypothetical protein VFP84_40440, partial [Kofleriaceae bacterium]|nr:hypothetical protein [Kofleriaceae bacterium]